MQLTKGTLLHGGTYKIEKVLGQGSFGITYLAEHVHLRRKVAIKEFFMKELNSRSEDGSITGMSDGSLSYNYAQKFKKEAFNLSRLDHPNIVRVTDSFEDNGTFYYVMDFIDGMNLNDYIKSSSPSEQTAVGIIKEVANALEYMHEEKQMLHLDLKPGNVMRRKSDGHVFLIDFGLSKHYDANGAPETSLVLLWIVCYLYIEKKEEKQLVKWGHSLFDQNSEWPHNAISPLCTDSSIDDVNRLCTSSMIFSLLHEIGHASNPPSIYKVEDISSEIEFTADKFAKSIYNDEIGIIRVY